MSNFESMDSIGFATFSSWFSFVPAPDLVHFGETCRAAHTVVNSLLAEKIRELTERLKCLDVERPFSLQYVPECCKKDRNFVAFAVCRDGLNYQFASDEFRKDPLIMRLAKVAILMFNPAMAGELQEFMKPIILSHPDIVKLQELNLLGPSLDEKEEALAREMFSQELLGEKGDFLPLVEEERQKELLRRAKINLTQRNGYLRVCSLLPFKEDKDFVFKNFLLCGASLFRYTDQGLLKDKAFVVKVIQNIPINSQNPEAGLGYLEKFQTDKDVVLAAVKRSGWEIQHASLKLQDDDDVAFAAVSQNGIAIRYVSERLKKMSKLALTAVGQCGTVLKFLDPNFQNNDEIVLKAVSQDGNALKYASSRCRADRKFVVAAVRKDRSALRHARSDLQTDKGFLKMLREL